MSNKTNEKIRFDRQEFSGAFGDIGTDFPLIAAMTLAAGLHTPGVLIVFGLMQVFTGIVYKMPMPVQPLKVMATLVIAQKIGGNVLIGGGLAVGAIMLVLSLSGALDKIARLIPKPVVRGGQLGLGLSLCSLSLKTYLPEGGLPGYVLAAAAFLTILFFIGNKKYPASLLALALGLAYAFFFDDLSPAALSGAFGFGFPRFQLPSIEDVSKGLVLLALPQIPLSLGNSIISTQQTAKDLFPDRPELSIKKIGLTYSLMNLIAPFFGGIPCCHGAGGMVGHHAFGGRTGGSVIIYGALFIFLGLFFGTGFDVAIKLFPLPVLGVILLFEGLSLMLLARDTAIGKKPFAITLLVAAIALGLPYGFFISMIVGTALFYSPVKIRWLEEGKTES